MGTRVIFKEGRPVRVIKTKDVKKDTKRTSRSKTTKPSEDYTKYGFIKGTTKLARPDGSVEYYKEGRLMREINPKGKVVIRTQFKRVDTGIKDIAKTGRTSREQAELRREQRYVNEVRKLQLDYKYAKEAEKKQAKRQLQKVEQLDVLKRAVQLKPSEQRLKQFNRFRASVKADPELKRLSELSKIEKSVSERMVGQSKRMEKIESGFKLIPGLRGEKVAQRFTRKLLALPSTLVTGIAESAYFAIPNVVDAVKVWKLRTPEERSAATKYTGKAILQSYNPKTMDGLLNIGVTVGMVAGMGLIAARRSGFKAQMKGAKLTGTSAKILKPKGKVSTVTIKGNLKLPTVKKLGLTTKGKTVPFEYKQIITKKVWNSKKFKSQGAIKYYDSTVRRILKKGKITKVKVPKVITKTVKTKGTIKKAVPKAKQMIVTEKGKRTLVTRKKITTLSLKDKSSLITRIANLKDRGKVISFTFKTEYVNVAPSFRTRLSTTIQKAIKGVKSELKTGKITRGQALVIGKNFKNLKKGLTQNKLMSHKKGTATLPSRAELYTKIKSRDFSHIDSVLKKLDDFYKAKTRPIVTPKVKPKMPTMKKLAYSNINLNPIFKGYTRSGVNLLFPAALQIPLVSTIKAAVIPIPKKAVIGGIEAKPTPGIIEGVEVPVIPITEAPAIPEVISPTKPTPTKPTPLPTTPTIFTISGLPFSRFIPFVAGLPIPGIGGAGRLFTLPMNKIFNRPSYAYSADLASKIRGVRATKFERTKLLKQGRSFTGLEERKLL